MSRSIVALTLSAALLGLACHSDKPPENPTSVAAEAPPEPEPAPEAAPPPEPEEPQPVRGPAP